MAIEQVIIPLIFKEGSGLVNWAVSTFYYNYNHFNQSGIKYKE